MFKSFKVSIQITEEIIRQGEVCRLVWNYFLTRNIEQYNINKHFVFYKEMAIELVLLKRDPNYAFLKDVHAQCLQQILMDLDNAINRSIKKISGFPKFKHKKDRSDSARYVQHFKVNSKCIKLSKKIKLKYRQHRPFEGKIKNITVKQDLDDWYAAVLCELPDVPQNTIFNDAIGIDLGLKTFAVLSDGTEYQTQKFYRKSQKKLAKRQRHLSKKAKQGSNRRKARKSVAKTQRHIRNQRRTQLNNWSKEITNRFDIICVEDLNIAGMIQNRNLAKAIQDQGWSEFMRQLEYKSKWRGNRFIRINRWAPSTKTCSGCGSIKHLTLDQRTYVCANCEMEMDRDLNAAINIKQMGLSTQSNQVWFMYLMKIPQKIVSTSAGLLSMQCIEC